MLKKLGLTPDLQPGQKLLGTSRLKARAGLLAGAVLMVGWALAPRTSSPILAVPDERAVPLLEQQVARRETEGVFRGLQAVAGRVARHSVAVPPATGDHPLLVRDYGSSPGKTPLPSGFGVVMSAAGDVMTHVDALDGRQALQVQVADGAFDEATVVAYEPETGLVLLRVPGATGPGPEYAPRAETGALVVAVGQWDGRVIAVPAFVSSVGPDAYMITAPEGSAPPGTPVYDIEGQLLAIAAGDGGNGRAFPVREAIARLTSLATTPQANPGSIGVVLQELDEALSVSFGERGALVSDVVPGGPADTAGLGPGDLLLDIDEIAVESAAGARQTVSSRAPGSQVALRLRRAGRVREMRVAVGSAVELAAAAVIRAPEDAVPEAHTIWDLQTLKQSSIPLTARVLRIDGRAVASPAQARRLANQSRPPTVVHLSHKGERFFASIADRP